MIQDAKVYEYFRKMKIAFNFQRIECCYPIVCPVGEDTCITLQIYGGTQPDKVRLALHLVLSCSGAAVSIAT